MTYTILTILTLLSFLWYSVHIRKNNSNKNYFISAIIPIIMYAITYGFRYGWAVDYKGYDLLYSGNRDRLDIDSYEPLFRIVIILLRNISESSSALFVSISILTIFSMILILRKHKDIIIYALPLFYLFTSYQAANLVRYFMAISLVYMGIAFLLDKKYKPTFVLFLSAFLIHYSAILLIFVVLLINKYRIFSNVKLNLVLFTIAIILNVGSIQQMFVEPLFRFISILHLGDNQLSKYADKDNISTVLLGTRFSGAVISLLYTALTIIFGYIFIIYGKRIFQIKNEENDLSFYYNIGVLGIILLKLSLGAEVFTRIALFFFYLTVIIVSYMFVYRKRIFRNASIVLLLLFISVLYIGYHSIKNLYDSFDLLYIWD